MYAPGTRAILKDLTKAQRQRIEEAISRLPSGNVVRLRSRPGRYRLKPRVGGWRVIFSRDDEAKEIRVERIAPRADAYTRGSDPSAGDGSYT